MVPPLAAWTRRFDERLETPGVPNRSLSLGALVKMLPMIYRLYTRMKKHDPVELDPINAFAPVYPGPTQGVPLGGLGCGSIGRGWQGEFRRWQMQPGWVQHAVVHADAFSVRVQRSGQPAQTQVLLPGEPEGSLAAWNWCLDESKAVYQALFPRAWTTYEEPVAGLRLTCRQVSPVIPHNYRESSYPAGVFVWEIENCAKDTATASLMFSFQNGTGTANDEAGGHFNSLFESKPEGVTGVILHHIHRQPKAGPPDPDTGLPEMLTDPLDFAIAVRGGPGIDVSYRTRFSTSGSGRDVWDDFTLDGRLDNLADERPAGEGAAIGAALVAKIDLQPGEKRELVFALAWDMPRVHSGKGTPYYRRYSLFYGPEGHHADQIASQALRSFPEWEAQIDAWQRPILEDPALPDWYKAALFNELYYLVDGGTLWAYPADQPLPAPEAQGYEHLGHFAYLEGHEYSMYNTYDVHFYASVALSMLWPELELSLQRDFAVAVMLDQPEVHQMLYTGKLAPRKLRGAVPHDLGLPGEDFWRLVNGYNIHDVNEWKDLNPKFVLQVYRIFARTRNLEFAAECWPAVQEAMTRVARFDRDGDGLIENDGFPDQTYDTWEVSGPSAYTGGLWLAALSAAACLAEALGKPAEADGYRAALAKGSSAYVEKLWNGQYFDYDSGHQNARHTTIMSDQLCGNWFALSAGLPPVVDVQKARSALETIYRCNVQGFQDGGMGAVNGMRPNGKVDRTSMQSAEVWVGTTYALAAAMLQAGMDEEAFATAHGLVDCTYRRFGYWFQTPEAWDEKGRYRSAAYMRPLAIWAMQWELECRKPAGAPGENRT
jgi:non-lysosomal glucosylceramidase